MPRRWKSSLFRAGSALALVLVLAGCTKGGQFDPTEIFNNDAFDTKKKIKGDREAVFPDGVPGTTTGVPPDLVKGYQPPPDQDADTTTAPAAAPAAAPAKVAAAPKPKPKPKPKVVVGAPQRQDSVWSQKPAASGPTRISVGPAAAPGAPGQQQADPIWPTPGQPAPAQQTAQPSQPNWPNPPAPGKFSQ